MKRQSVWVSSETLAAEWECSLVHIKRLREDGTFKPNYHWRNISPKSPRPTYRYHRERCAQAFEVEATLTLVPDASESHHESVG